MSASTTDAEAKASAQGRKTKRIFCSTILLSEALVIFFALLVAKDLTDVSGAVLAAVGGTAILACLLLAGLLRHAWAYPAGGALQVLLIASGWWVPAMVILGVIFGALWVLSLVLARRVEQFHRGAEAGGAASL